MIKKLLLLCVTLNLFATNPCYAKNRPLKVGVPTFSPPFVVQTTDNQFYGFDIAMIEYVCKALERKCEYYPTREDSLVDKVTNQSVDIAVGGIVLTLKRAKNMRFSIPYLASSAQFIALDNRKFPENFTLRDLNGLKVGILVGSALERKIRYLDMNPKAEIIEFDKTSQIIRALNKKTIDIALLSEPQVHYWRSNSSDIFQPVGDEFPIGYGFAIAVNTSSNHGLISEINSVLFKYQKSQEFKQNFYVYFHDHIKKMPQPMEPLQSGEQSSSKDASAL